MNVERTEKLEVITKIDGDDVDVQVIAKDWEVEITCGNSIQNFSTAEALIAALQEWVDRKKASEAA